MNNKIKKVLKKLWEVSRTEGGIWFWQALSFFLAASIGAYIGASLFWNNP